VGTQPQNAPQGNYNAPRNSNGTYGSQHNGNFPSHQRGVQAVPRHDVRNNAPRGPQVPRMEAPNASGSSYNLNQPVNQGGVNGVIPGGPARRR
jgi:hypothetical protein